MGYLVLSQRILHFLTSPSAPFQRAISWVSMDCSVCLLYTCLEGMSPVLWDFSISLLSKAMPLILLTDKPVNQPVN